MFTSHGINREVFDGASVYRIVALGRLDPKWEDHLGGLAMRLADGEPLRTELNGVLADQAALMGVLELLYARGVSILLVERVGPAPTADTR